MNITESHEGKAAILALTGALDNRGAPPLSIRGFAMCDLPINTLVIDFAEVPHVTSAGFRAMIAVTRRAAEGQIAVILCGLNGLVRELFQIGGLLNAFTVVPDRAAALALPR